MKTIISLLLALMCCPALAEGTVWYWNFKTSPEVGGVGFEDNQTLRDCMGALLPVILKDGSRVTRNNNGFVVQGSGPVALKHARDIWMRQEPEKLIFPVKTELSLVIVGFAQDQLILNGVTHDMDVFTVNYSVVPEPVLQPGESRFTEGSAGQDMSRYPWASIAIIPIGKLGLGKYEVDIAPNSWICPSFQFEVK